MLTMLLCHHARTPTRPLLLLPACAWFSLSANLPGLDFDRILIFKKAAKGDTSGTLERISRCVEVYERYPGLCRCLMRWWVMQHARNSISCMARHG